MKSYYNLFEYREIGENDIFSDYYNMGLCADLCVRFRSGKKICFAISSRETIVVARELFKRDIKDRTKNRCFPFIERTKK